MYMPTLECWFSKLLQQVLPCEFLDVDYRVQNAGLRKCCPWHM